MTQHKAGILCEVQFAEGLQASATCTDITGEAGGDQVLEAGEISEEQRGSFLA